VDFAKIKREERVLDAGAGTGAVTRAAVSTGAQAVAFDISTTMLMAARRGGATHVVNGSLPTLPFIDASFDAVLSAFVLTHIDDPEAAVRDMRRVLRPGGRVALSAWAPSDDVYTATCAEVMAEFIDPARIAEASKRVLPGESRFAQPDGLASLLAACGFNDIRKETRTFEFTCSVEELVASREVCASGRTLRTLLDDATWKAYRTRSVEILGKKYPGGIRYPRPVHFAAAQL
jgi:ubiquinone/menaquinone biosynthesis C-methylase UbiE